MVTEPDSDSPDLLRQAKQARAHSQALRNRVAEGAEAVAEVEQEAALLAIERLGWIAEPRPEDVTAVSGGRRLGLDRGPARVVLRFDAAPVMFGCSTVELVPCRWRRLVPVWTEYLRADGGRDKHP
jgi:hypothetical protein